MRCLERVVRNIIVEQVKACMNPFQFDDWEKRGVQDAVVILFKKEAACAWVLFIHF